MGNKYGRLVLEKTIYAKRKSVSKEDMQDIFKMEIEHHLRQNPDLEFTGYGKMVENADRSKTFPIIFSPKVKHPESVQKPSDELQTTH